MTKEEALAHLRDYAHGFYKGSTDRIPPHSFDLNRETTDILEAALLRDMQRWIPCSERLPEHRLYVLVTYKYEYGLIDNGITWYSETENKWNTSREVIAWMPLPEPYREEGEQE